MQINSGLPEDFNPSAYDMIVVGARVEILRET